MTQGRRFEPTNVEVPFAGVVGRVVVVVLLSGWRLVQLLYERTVPVVGGATQKVCAYFLSCEFGVVALRAGYPRRRSVRGLYKHDSWSDPVGADHFSGVSRGAGLQVSLHSQG